MCMPRPSQAGQAPCGLLNENKRGVNSGQLVPQSGTGEALAKHELLAIDELYAHETFGVGEGCFNRIGQTRCHVWPYDQTIHDNVDGVVQISIKVRQGIKQERYHRQCGRAKIPGV